MRWYLLNSGAGPSAENMAWDEALLSSSQQLGQPVLRFYGWREPAATFGYFQKYSEVEGMTALRPLIRRCTGGGLVPHDADWTYSLAFPPGDPWYELRATESYRRVHDWIRMAFERLGSAAELSPCCRKEAPGRCFIGAEQFDVLLDGQKIAGAAQRRTRDGLLIQGSIQPPPRASRAEFEQALCEVASTVWAVDWEPLEVDEELRSQVAQLTAEKYSRKDFNERR